MNTVGALRIRSSRPGLVDGGEAGPHGVDVELTVGAGAEERLDRGQRDDGVVRLMLAVQRQEDLGVHPAEALQLEQLSADGDLPARAPRTPNPRGPPRRRPRTACASSTSIASGSLPRDHRDGVDRAPARRPAC